jgi:hypothetical protein
MKKKYYFYIKKHFKKINHCIYIDTHTHISVVMENKNGEKVMLKERSLD